MANQLEHIMHAMTKNKSLYQDLPDPTPKSLYLPSKSNAYQHALSDLVGLVRTLIEAPPINLVNLQVIQNHVIHSSDIDRSHRRLENVVKINSVDNIDTTKTAETVESPLGTKKVVC